MSYLLGTRVSFDIPVFKQWNSFLIKLQSELEIILFPKLDHFNGIDLAKKYKHNRYCVPLFMYKGNIKTNPQTEIGPSYYKLIYPKKSEMKA